MTPPDTCSVNLPDGGRATFEEMQQYGETLQAFIREQEAKLADIEDPRRHNEIIDYLQMLAEGYNEQLRRFRTAQAQRQNAVVILWGPPLE